MRGGRDVSAGKGGPHDRHDVTTGRRQGRGRVRWPVAGLVLAGTLVAAAFGTWSWTVPATVRLRHLAPVHEVLRSRRAAAASPFPDLPIDLARRLLGHTTPAAQPAPVLETIGPDPAVSPARPVAIRIPYLGVHATVVPEPVGRGGQLRIPEPTEVGWFDAGPAPGQPGTTVIAGHIDLFGVDGAFLRLSDLPIGAVVTLVSADGTDHVYVVRRRLLLSQRALAAAHLFRAGGPSRLVLLSCGGAYDAATHLYLDNVVVEAVPVPT